MKWRFTKISNVCMPTVQIDPKTLPSETFSYIDISAIDNELKTIVAQQTIQKTDAPSRARKQIIAGDILVSTVRPNLNAVAMVPRELDRQIASTGFCVLRPKDYVINRKYLFYFTLTPLFIERLSAHVTGAHYPAVSDSIVKGVDIPLPTLSEQSCIVEILDQADALRKKRAEADKKAERILPSLFYKMFGSNKWPMVRLGNMCDVVSGATPKTDVPDYWGGNILWVTPTDLSGLDDYVLERTERTISGAGYKSCSATLVPKNTVLLSSRAPIGHVAVAGHEMCSNQGLKNLVCSNRINPWYLFSWLKLNTDYLNSMGCGATFKEISKSVVEEINLPLPEKSWQDKFSDYIELIRKIRIKKFATKRKLDALFSLILFKAFSGDLTAKWREAHMKELLAEMEEQAKYLEEVRMEDV